MKKYGYIRVSTKEQNPDRQLAALQEYDIPKENIWIRCRERIFGGLSIKGSRRH